MQKGISYGPLNKLAKQITSKIKENDNIQDLYLEVKFAKIKSSSSNLNKYRLWSNKQIVFINEQQDRKNFKFAADADLETYNIFLQNLNNAKKKDKIKFEEEDSINLNFTKQRFVYEQNQKKWIVRQKKPIFEWQKDFILKQKPLRCQFSALIRYPNKALNQILDVLADDIPISIIRQKNEKFFIFHDFKITLSKIIQIQSQQLAQLLNKKAIELQNSKEEEAGLHSVIALEITEFIKNKKLKADKFEIELRFLVPGLKKISKLKTNDQVEYLGQIMQKFISFQVIKKEEDLAKLIQGLSIRDD